MNDKQVQLAQSEFSRMLDLVIEKLCYGRADELPPELQERVGRRMNLLVRRGQPLVNKSYALPKRRAARDARLVEAALLLPHGSAEERATLIANIVKGKISRQAAPADVYEKISAAADCIDVPETVRQLAGILRKSGKFESHARGHRKRSL